MPMSSISSARLNAVCLAIGNMPELPQELIDERRQLFRVSLDPEQLRTRRALYLQRVNGHIAWLAQALSDVPKCVSNVCGRPLRLSPDLVCEAERAMRSTT